MTPESADAVLRVFEEALRREPDARPALLDVLCDGGVELRRQVERLLEANDRAGRDRPRENPPSPTMDGERGAASWPLPQGLEIHILCPHCRNPIELVARPTIPDILCPACGSTFRLERDSTATWSCADHPRYLGRFELLEVVGFGSFGTVYKARDPQLDRVVAIKVPRAGSLTTESDQKRFVREGRNVARLRHPGIVPLHDVGQAENVPYLVSDFVQGVTLADMLTARRLLPAESARIVAAVLDALAYAHGQGIVHRDVKPSNVMLDEDGRPHLMDFGLAKRDAGEVTMTLDGQVLGTPAYMSPEQARGESHRVDGRSDVYSVGVVLYQLLTGDLPFRGNSRMLLHQVLHDEPKPPRRLNDRISRDLETITLKAMAKDPAKRYATAAAFAEDLRNHLEGRPIQARPVGSFERAWRWSRRNRAVASLIAGIFALLAGGLTVVSILLYQAETLRELAERRRTNAESISGIAESRRIQAENNLAEVERQRALADANFGKAMSVVKDYLTRVGDDELLKYPGMQPLRRELLGSALKFYQSFLDERRDDPHAQLMVAEALTRVGRIQNELGAAEESRRAFDSATTRYEAIVGRDPKDADARSGLAECRFWNGDTQKAIEIWTDVIREQPARRDVLASLGQAYNTLAIEQKDTAEMLRYHRLALEVQERLVVSDSDDAEYRNQLGYTQNNIGVMLAGMGHTADALAMYRRGVEQKRLALAKRAGSVTIASGLALVLNNQAGMEERLGDPTAAVETFRSSIELQRRLVAENPAIPQLRPALLGTYLRAANLLRRVGRTEQAIQSQRQAMELLAAMPLESPNHLYNAACARAMYASLLGSQEGQEKKAEVEAGREQADQAIALLTQAVEKGYRNAGWIRSDRDLDSLRTRSDFQALLSRLDRLQEADRLAELARKQEEKEQRLETRRAELALREKLAATVPDSSSHRRDLAENLHAVGRIQADLKLHEEARSSLEQSLTIRRDLLGRKPDGQADQSGLSNTLFALGTLTWNSGELRVAEARWDESLKLLEELVRKRPSDTTLRGRLATSLVEIADLERGLDLTEPAERRYARAFELQAPGLAGIWRNRAVLLLARGDRPGYDRVIEAFRRRFPDPGPYDLPEMLIACAIAPWPAEFPNSAARELVAMADRAISSSPKQAWVSAGAAMVHLRAGDPEAGRRLALESLHNDPWQLRAPLVMVLVLDRLGAKDKARRWLARVDARWEREVRLLLNRRLPAALDPPELTELALLDQEARRLVHGPEARFNPWIRLIRARAHAALGQLADAERELDLAIEAQPGKSRIWAERARIHAELGHDDRADADIQRGLALAPGDPYPLLVRAHRRFERAQVTLATADLADASSRCGGNLDHQFDGGWWVAGPYPGPLNASCPPEQHPASEVGFSTGTGPERKLSPSVDWQGLGRSGSDSDQPARVMRIRNDEMFYALAFVYVPNTRQTQLHIGTQGGRRVWVNGTLVHESSKPGGWAHQPDKIPLTLRPGLNSILMKLQMAGTGGFHAGFSDTELDLGLRLAAGGLWDEAREVYKRLELIHAPDPHITRLHATILVALGDEAGFGSLRSDVLDPLNPPQDPSFWLTLTCLLMPSPVADAARWQDWLDRTPGSNWPDQAYRGQYLALARYRAGRFEEALKQLESVPDGDWRGLKPIIAALCQHRLGHDAEARKSLDQARRWYRALQRDVLKRPMNQVNGDWLSVGVVQSLLREAGTNIEGRRPGLEPLDLLVRAAERYRAGFKEAADQDVMAALTLDPTNLDAWRLHLDEAKRRGRPPNVEQLFDQFLARHEGHLDPGRIAVAAVNLQCWNRAAIVSAQVLEAAPITSHHSWQFVPMSAELIGNHAEYRRLCRLLVQRVAKGAAQESLPAARAAIATADSGVDPAWVVREAECGVRDHPTLSWTHHLLAMALYRASRYEEALDAEARALERLGTQDHARALPKLGIALSRYRLGQSEAARSTLLESTRNVDAWLAQSADSTKPPMYLADWIEYLLLRREAEAVILYDPGFPENPFAPTPP